MAKSPTQSYQKATGAKSPVQPYLNVSSAKSPTRSHLKSPDQSYRELNGSKADLPYKQLEKNKRPTAFQSPSYLGNGSGIQTVL